MIPYITYSDLAADIAAGIDKIPHDIDGVICIPRSGLLPGSIIAGTLNLPITTVDVFSNALTFGDAFLGKGLRAVRTNGGRRFLVVDDTCFNGSAMRRAWDTLSHCALGRMCEFLFMPVYLEKKAGGAAPPRKFWLKDLSGLKEASDMGIVLYEWNRFHHYPQIGSAMLYDLDGVLVMDPPDERDAAAYESYIKDPVPKYIPTGPVSVCTYRLEKWRGVTEESLRRLGVDLRRMVMTEGTYESRGLVSPEEYKARVYSSGEWKLFVESSDRQAREIRRLSGKPVMSVQANCIY